MHIYKIVIKIQFIIIKKGRQIGKVSLPIWKIINGCGKKINNKKKNEWVQIFFSYHHVRQKLYLMLSIILIISFSIHSVYFVLERSYIKS
ncbi:MAG: hypothetical protein AUJ85_03205 [Elusimicrobia bacterium CG1_02_37_114]|nr:MAG: hypothetical protein AUJ85_03205 [Elusimicrobia bacterium CG1_02_37_114]PIV53330.1 MAG: hypothetical protein COS17_04490 [Elusimicrobia bacterium CG02_land_8_20_14_3_00_37_13]